MVFAAGKGMSADGGDEARELVMYGGCLRKAWVFEVGFERGIL